MATRARQGYRPHSKSPFCHTSYSVGAHAGAELVAVGAQEQAELYLDGSLPQPEVKRGMNPVVAVLIAVVYVAQNALAVERRVGSAVGNMAR